MGKSLKDNIAFATKLSGVFIWNLLKTHFLGTLLTVVFIILGLFILSSQIDAGKSGHVSAIPFIILSITSKPFSAIPFYLYMLICPYLLFSFAGKYAITKVINTLLKNKSDSLIVPSLDKILNTIKDKQPDFFKSGVAFSKSKIKLISEVKNSNENKVVKKIINYTLEKINFSDVDFSNEHLSYTEIIRNKIIEKLHEVSESSYKPFWIIIAVQWVILAVMYFTKY